MKKIILALLITISSNLFAQYLVENETDKFTKKVKKSTNYEWLFYGMTNQAKFCVIKQNESHFFRAKMTLGGDVFSIRTDSEMIFLFEDDSTITLKASEYFITGMGEGVGYNTRGINAYYFVDEYYLNDFKTKTVKEIRVYTSDGYVDFTIGKNIAPKIKNAFELVDE